MAHRPPPAPVPPVPVPMPAIDLVEEVVALDGGEGAARGDVVHLLRPADPAALLDEDAFAENEYLPYWAELWPAARRLAEALPASLAGCRILELGCGLGLPSLVAAGRGGSVVATDWSPEALGLLEVNARRNGVRLDVALVDWADPPPALLHAGFDLVVAADVAYETRNVEPLADLLEALACEVLLADPGRAAGRTLLDRLGRRFRASDLGSGVTRLVPRPTRLTSRALPPR